MNFNSCPYYQECDGTYFQGCWEFTDICYLSPLVDGNPFCNDSCFLLNENEEDMLRTFLEPYHNGKRIYTQKQVLRPLTDSEKSDIIKEMERCMKLINEVKNPPSVYK